MKVAHTRTKLRPKLRRTVQDLQGLLSLRGLLKVGARQLRYLHAVLREGAIVQYSTRFAFVHGGLDLDHGAVCRVVIQNGVRVSRVVATTQRRQDLFVVRVAVRLRIYCDEVLKNLGRLDRVLGQLL